MLPGWASTTIEAVAAVAALLAAFFAWRSVKAAQLTVLVGRETVDLMRQAQSQEQQVRRLETVAEIVRLVTEIQERAQAAMEGQPQWPFHAARAKLRARLALVDDYLPSTRKLVDVNDARQGWNGASDAIMELEAVLQGHVIAAG